MLLHGRGISSARVAAEEHEKGEMDAHLIGIDLAHLVIKLNEPTQKKPFKAATTAKGPNQQEPHPNLIEPGS